MYVLDFDIKRQLGGYVQYLRPFSRLAKATPHENESIAYYLSLAGIDLRLVEDEKVMMRALRAALWQVRYPWAPMRPFENKCFYIDDGKAGRILLDVELVQINDDDVLLQEIQKANPGVWVNGKWMPKPPKMEGKKDG